MNQRRPTIRDVAEAAGVSRAAVSLVLNNGVIRISDEKRDVIRAAAKRLGYQPHSGARRLSSGLTETISLVFPYTPLALSQLFIYELTRRIAAAAQTVGYDILIDLFHAAHPERSLLRSGRVDAALVICDQHIDDTAYLQELITSSTPVLVIGGHYLKTAPREFIDVDLAAGTHAMVDHLIKCGHRRIAFLAASPSNEKLQGYREALAAAAISPASTQVIQSAKDDKAIETAISHLVDLADPPTAIVAANDALALRVIKALHQRGVRVPADISVTGFDDIELANLSTPSLTSVAFPADTVAQKAIQALIQRISTPDAPPVQLTLAPKLIIRESTGSAMSRPAVQSHRVTKP